jgi:hypothetical protein
VQFVTDIYGQAAKNNHPCPIEQGQFGPSLTTPVNKLRQYIICFGSEVVMCLVMNTPFHMVRVFWRRLIKLDGIYKAGLKQAK